MLESELVARDLPADTPDAVRQLQTEIVATMRRSLDDLRSPGSASCVSNPSWPRHAGA